MRHLIPLVYLVFRSLPTLADPDSLSIVSPSRLPIITKAIMDMTTHASITNHGAVFQSESVNSVYSWSTIASGAEASPTASIHSPFPQPVIKRAHHDPGELPADPPYYTLMLWVNGYDVTIPILKDNATEFCKSIADEAPSESSLITSTLTQTRKSAINPDKSEASGLTSKSESNSDILTDGSPSKTTPTTLAHSKNASKTTGAGSEMDNSSEPTDLPKEDSSEDASTSRTASKKLSLTSGYSHSDNTKDSPSTGSAHEMSASHEETTTQDSPTAIRSSATMTLAKSSLPTIHNSSLLPSSESGEPSATDKSPDAWQDGGEMQEANAIEAFKLMASRLGPRVDGEVFAVSKSTNREEDAENPIDFADTEKPNEPDIVARDFATPASYAHPSERPEAFVHVREQVSQAAHNFQPLAWLRAAFVWRRNFDISLHDASTPEKVQGWSKADHKEKRSSYVPNDSHAAGEEEKRPILDREASSLAKLDNTEEGAEAEEQTQTEKPTFGFNPHPRPLPTSPTDEEKATTDTDTTDSPLPSSTYHNSFKTHTSPSPTKTSSAPSHLPQLGITDPVPPQNHTAPTAPANGTQSGAVFNGSGRWSNNPFTSPLFWGVGAFYLGFAYWEGWQQARGDVVHPDFVNAGVRWIGEEMVRHL